MNDPHDTRDLSRCSVDAGRVTACDEVVLRLHAAERDERQLRLDASELRSTAARIASTHLQAIGLSTRPADDDCRYDA